MSDEKEEVEPTTAYGHINEVKDENNNVTYLDDNNHPFEVVGGVCINGYYYNEHLKTPVRVLHVDVDNNRVFFFYRLPYPSKKRTNDWICYLDVFTKTFRTTPFEKLVKGACESCANVTIEEDFTITHRNRGVVLEINNIYGKWNRKPTKEQVAEFNKEKAKHTKKEKPGNRKSRQRHNRNDKLKKNKA